MNPGLTRYTSCGVTLLGDTNRPHGVTLCFTERTGGLSKGEFSSLNLGLCCGDDPHCVEQNRALALKAAGFMGDVSSVICPKQVHGDDVLIVRNNNTQNKDSLADLQAEGEKGYDAIVCLASGLPVLLCYADCVPVVLSAPGGFAVIHSGWKGTLAQISAKALHILCEEASCAPQDVVAYIGPHICGEDYEVSEELISRFINEFGICAEHSYRHLDLANCISKTLIDAGISQSAMVVCEDSTASNTDRFFSYRAEGGMCGRIGAIAWVEA